MLKQCEGFEELAQVGSIDLAAINPSLLDGDWTDLVRELRGDKHGVPVLVLTADCGDIDPPTPCMYEWLSRALNGTLCTPHAMWLNHTEIRCH
jgi:hypothetical protein